MRLSHRPFYVIRKHEFIAKYGLIREVCTFYSIGRYPNSLWPSVVEGCDDGLLAPGRTVPTGTWNGPSQSGASRKEGVTIRSTSLKVKPLWDGPFQVPVGTVRPGASKPSSQPSTTLGQRLLGYRPML